MATRSPQASPANYHGSLIAFEGPSDVVSTQLRLLPSSPQILVIPPLQHFLSDPDGGVPFDLAAFVLGIHEACHERVGMAKSFLRDATPDSKRLVFMHGGTAHAQMRCITEISRHLTGGNMAEAEATFNNLVRDGVSGLRGESELTLPSSSNNSSSSSRPSQHSKNNSLQDPISAAMRAAEALDRETASLQPNNDVDFSCRHRSRSVPAHLLQDSLEGAAPFYIFGAAESIDREKPQIAKQDVSWNVGMFVDQDATPRARANLDVPLLSPIGGLESIACSGDALSLDSPCSGSFVNRFSNRTVAFGPLPDSPLTGCLPSPGVDSLLSPASTVRPTMARKRVKSFDSAYSSPTRSSYMSLGDLTRPREAPSTSNKACSPMPTPGALPAPHPRYHAFPAVGRPKVRKSPPVPLDLTGATPKPCSALAERGAAWDGHHVDEEAWSKPLYVDRGVDAHDMDEVIRKRRPTPKRHFETVLPMAEDLVLSIKNSTPDAFLDSVIEGFRKGVYPVTSPPTTPLAEVRTGILDPVSPPTATPPAEMSTALPVASKPADDDEYDPFAAHAYPHYPSVICPSRASSKHRSTLIEPPTPARTPLVKTSGTNFHDLCTTNLRTAVCVQNLLRSVLKIYFSPDDTGYRQFTFPLLPESNGLWKPVFRDIDSGDPKKERRQVDLILAIGAQKGVAKDFLSNISGTLEKLGTRAKGAKRSGRVDLGYFMANAMQSFTSQPLAKQTQENPFSNPLLLATLIIPHLETYLAAHSETRFLLLEYAPEHLSTVLALQRLVGVDLLKVAALLSADAAEPIAPGSPRSPPPMLQRRMTHHSKASSVSSRASTVLLSATHLRSPDTSPFAKANFLLTSSASDSEITAFISAVWKVLIDISPFYIPEGAPRSSAQFKAAGLEPPRDAASGVASPLIDAQPKYAPLANAAAMVTPKASIDMPPTPAATPRATAADASPADAAGRPHIAHHLKPSLGGHARQISAGASLPQSQQQQLSLAETIKTHRSTRSLANHRMKLQKVLGREASLDVDLATARGFLDSDGDEYDDEDLLFAAEQRMYMPMFDRPAGARKGNSRKALKWLGLA